MRCISEYQKGSEREVSLQIGCGFIYFLKTRDLALFLFCEPCYHLYPFSSTVGEVSVLLLAENINENLIFLILLFILTRLTL